MKQSIEQWVDKILPRLSGFVFCKNIDSKFLGASVSIIKAAGFTEAAEIRYKSDHELPWAAFADEYHEYDQLALKGEPIEYMVPFSIADQSRLILHVRKFMLSTPNESFLIGYGQIVACSNKKSSLINRDDLSYFSDKRLFRTIIKNPNYCLSNRESEVLYFLIRGYSAKKIASKLFLGTRTIETHIDHIKRKFDCTTKAELIEAVIDSGFANYIPSSLIEKQ